VTDGSLARVFCALAGVLCVVAAAGVAWGCDTPVYRYAMYNWAAAPYYVFYFHQGQPAEEDQAVNKMLDELPDAEPAAANVLLTVVDASKAEQLEQLPPEVVAAWKARAGSGAPAHFVFSPWGVELLAGRLDLQEAQAMVDSPARRRLGELLEEGNVAVLLILGGSDEAGNQRAEKVAGEVVAKGAAGEIPLVPIACDYAEPGDTAADDAQQASPQTIRLATLKVSRDDPAEKWLVRMLLAAEPDLHQYSREPMVFAVYGRGRTMPPYVGEGITLDNLTECVLFLVGECSCMVRDQNPGTDLLVRWDWQSAAEKMAADDEGIGGGPWGYREFSPDDAGNLSEVTGRGDDAGGVASAAQAAAETQKLIGSPGPPGGDAADNGAQSLANRQTLTLGLGLAAGAVCVLVAGLVLFWRRRPA
jgi:hypothetical protein